MRRIVVLGGLGFFGRAAVGVLRGRGARPVVASRRDEAELRVDAEDPGSLRRGLRRSDVVLDAAGPFQGRSPVLIEAAIEVGFDVVDLSESVAYSLLVRGLRERVDAAGIRVLTSCSSVSAISAAVVRASGITKPRSVEVFLAPATRYTARPGTGAALLASIGRPIRVWRGGRLVEAIGWSESRAFELPAPAGHARGWLFESADAVLLPAVWPSLRNVGFWTDARAPGMNAMFALAARRPRLRRRMERMQRFGLALARTLGAKDSTLAFEIEGPEGPPARAALRARERGYLAPVVPAVLAALAIAGGDFEPRGLVPPDRHVEPAALLRELRSLGFEALGAIAQIRGA